VERGYYKNASFYRVLNDENQPSNAAKAELDTKAAPIAASPN